MEIILPEFCLVLLIGMTGSGKSHFSQKHFGENEVLSEGSFEALYAFADDRLFQKKLTVIDVATAESECRQHLITIAKQHHCRVFAIVFNLPNDDASFKKSLKRLANEKYREIYTFKSEEDIQNAIVARHKLASNKNDISGPLDIIGDIHGCYDELILLLVKLGYSVNEHLIETDSLAVTHNDKRRIVFLGDLVDRGPHSKKVVDLVMNMVANGAAWCVMGNHESKFLRYLMGKNVQPKHGLDATINDFRETSDEYRAKVIKFIKKLTDHFVFDNGKLIVAHAGLKEEYHGRHSGVVFSFALYGEITGEFDEQGLPVRNDWAKDYQGAGLVVYGHYAVKEAVWVNNTICIDTGCVFGGKLTALKYPERELVSVLAKKL